MESDPILKRFDWLEEEHRKNKAALEAMAEKLAYAESQIKVANKKIKELNTELSQYSNVPARIDQFNDALSQQRVDILKYVDEMDNKDVDKLPEAEKRIQGQFDLLNKSLVELRKFKDPIAEIKRGIKINADEEVRLGNQFSEWEKRLKELTEAVEEL